MLLRPVRGEGLAGLLQKVEKLTERKGREDHTGMAESRSPEKLGAGRGPCKMQA